VYELQFVTPGTYQFFLRYSLYESAGNVTTFLNEDSIFLPPAFNKNSGSDWIDAPILDFDDMDETVDLPVNGEALDPDGYKPKLGDHINDGALELVFGNWKDAEDAGGSSATIIPGAGHMENGHFDWYNRPTFTGALPGTGGFDGFFASKVEYTVTEDMVGDVLTFEIGIREINVTIDGFAFVQTSNIYPNMDLLDLYFQSDLDAAFLPQPVPGDYNGDGVNNAADYTVWRDGGSPDDTQAGYDLWKANFGASGGGSGAAVPEPASIAMLLVGVGLFAVRFRR
jgi:hypothetical protein